MSYGQAPFNNFYLSQYGWDTRFLITSPTNRQYLVYNSTLRKWVNIDDRFSITSATNGQILVYNSTSGKWENVAGINYDRTNYILNIYDPLTLTNYWSLGSYGDIFNLTSSKTSAGLSLTEDGLLILGSVSSTNAGLRLEDRTTANDWNVYSTADKLTFDYNGTTISADLSQTGNLILRGTDARIQFRQSTTNDQRLYWNSTYGLILDSPTTSAFGGRILLNQITFQTGGFWNNLTGIDLNAKPIANASTISCSGNITTSAGDITATDGAFTTGGLGAGYYIYDRATPATTFWVNFVPSGATTHIFYYRIPATATNLEIFRMTNTGLLSTIGSFTNGATGKGLQLGDRATTSAVCWQVYNDTQVLNFANQNNSGSALSTKFRCNTSGQFDVLGSLASVNLADRSNNANFWANYHNGGTLAWYNSQDRLTLSSAGKLSMTSDLDVGTANPATTTINMSATTRCQITTTLATMGTLLWDVGYSDWSSGTVSSATGTAEISTTQFAYFHTAPLYNGKPFACSKLGELEVNHDTNAGGGSSLWYVPCYWNSGASPIGGIKQVNTTTVSFPTTSDRRLKEQIEDLTEDRVSTIIDTLKPRAYVWKESQEPAIGFIADELQAVMPDCVYGEPNAVNKEGKPEYQTADSASPSMIAVLVAELQFLRKRVLNLENKIIELSK